VTLMLYTHTDEGKKLVDVIRPSTIWIDIFNGLKSREGQSICNMSRYYASSWLDKISPYELWTNGLACCVSSEYPDSYEFSNMSLQTLEEKMLEMHKMRMSDDAGILIRQADVFTIRATMNKEIRVPCSSVKVYRTKAQTKIMCKRAAVSYFFVILLNFVYTKGYIKAK